MCIVINIPFIVKNKMYFSYKLIADKSNKTKSFFVGIFDKTSEQLVNHAWQNN